MTSIIPLSPRPPERPATKSEAAAAPADFQGVLSRMAGRPNGSQADVEDGREASERAKRFNEDGFFAKAEMRAGGDGKGAVVESISADDRSIDVSWAGSAIDPLGVVAPAMEPAAPNDCGHASGFAVPQSRTALPPHRDVGRSDPAVVGTVSNDTVETDWVEAGEPGFPAGRGFGMARRASATAALSPLHVSLDTTGAGTVAVIRTGAIDPIERERLRQDAMRLLGEYVFGRRDVRIQEQPVPRAGSGI